ncbi:hypothetical protein RB195_016016 [Necator americanus]|uniref:Uncharacterized protein n=1 Tax=Necator americanus TaxID=51031 RepID=A0ABR1E765_NECAM
MFLAVLIFYAVVLSSISGNEVDYDDEEGPFIPISTEEFTGFMGRAQPKCQEYKFSCQRFVKCFENCNEQLIYASELNGVTGGLTEEQKTEAKRVKTNPCVGMLAYCLSVDFFTLRRILRLQSADAF